MWLFRLAQKPNVKSNVTPRTTSRPSHAQLLPTIPPQRFQIRPFPCRFDPSFFALFEIFSWRLWLNTRFYAKPEIGVALSVAGSCRCGLPIYIHRIWACRSFSSPEDYFDSLPCETRPPCTAKIKFSDSRARADTSCKDRKERDWAPRTFPNRLVQGFRTSFSTDVPISVAQIWKRPVLSV
jgi:hypothetical protein